MVWTFQTSQIIRGRSALTLQSEKGKIGGAEFSVYNPDMWNKILQKLQIRFKKVLWDGMYRFSCLEISVKIIFCEIQIWSALGCFWKNCAVSNVGGSITISTCPCAEVIRQDSDTAAWVEVAQGVKCLKTTKAGKMCFICERHPFICINVTATHWFLHEHSEVVVMLSCVVFLNE